ncbi:hypothetical protein BTVI_131594 [Pitangus sulphuratus]|nr:hypothetical protein BTVI_131594 [Pitangus sulphuratus]
MPLETNAAFNESTKCKTKAQLEASTASVKPTDTGVSIMDFMNMGIHMTTSTANSMTETGAHTTNSEITITPITKKKTWIREDAGSTSLTPQLRSVTEEEEEEEGAKGPRIPLCREFIPSDYELKEEEEEVAVREGVRPKELGACPKELGAHPKEKGTHPKKGGAAAQVPDKTQKAPRRMLTPDYTLLGCSKEEIEGYLRSSSWGLEDYSLHPPLRNLSQCRAQSPSPQPRKPSPRCTQPCLYLHNTETHPQGMLCLHLHVREAEREWKQSHVDTSKEKWKWIGGTSILKQELCEHLKYYNQ